MEFQGIVDLNISPKDKIPKSSGVVAHLGDFPFLSGIREGKLENIALNLDSYFGIYIESHWSRERLSILFQYAKMKKKPIICKISEENSEDGLLYDTENSFKFGHQTRSQLGEALQVAVMVEFVREFGVKTLFKGVTSQRALEIVFKEKESGVPIFLEVSIFHLIFDDSIYSNFDNYTKIDPPFQNIEGVEFLKENISQIDMFTSLHRDFLEYEKGGSFKDAVYGISNLENLFSIYYTFLIKTLILTFEELETKTSKNQLRFLGIEKKLPKFKVDSKKIEIGEKNSFDKLFSKGGLYGRVI
jgi:dihydroorotase-like cyclic amidohydrolase